MDLSNRNAKIYDMKTSLRFATPPKENHTSCLMTYISPSALPFRQSDRRELMPVKETVSEISTRSSEDGCVCISLRAPEAFDGIFSNLPYVRAKSGILKM